MEKRKLSILFMAAGVLTLLFSFPALAGDIGPSASGEPTNQARIIAGVIQARKLVYWSVWTDRAAAYARDPKNQPAPKWPTATEIKNQVGGETPSGFTFAETNMPAARDNSFRLVVTVASSRGGAAAAEKVTMFLPMAAVSGTKITIPVTRPADALAAGTLMSEYVRRDGTTPDGQSTVFSGKEVTLGEGARLHFQGAGGDVENVSSLTAKTVVAAKELQLSSGAGAKIQIGANGIPRYQPLNRSSWYSFITAENIASQAVSSAGKWATARKIALSGGAIAAGVAVDGTKDVVLNVTSLNAARLTGTIDAARLPLSAPNMTVGSAEMAKYAQIATTATRAFQAGIATEAARATYAASAGYATNAGSASNANYATSAGSATSASSANYATSAGSAGSAGNSSTVGGYTVAQILAAARGAATITQTGRSGNNWYRVWSDGFKEQGYYVPYVSCISWATVHLLVPMSTTSYVLVANYTNSQDNDFNELFFPTRTTTWFRLGFKHAYNNVAAHDTYVYVAGY